MPRKKSESTEAKKSRKASKDRINSSPSAEILPPPMPTQSHLVASNPFDDIPSSPMHGGPNPRFQGMHPAGGMVSPPYGAPIGNPGWNPRMRPPFNPQNWGHVGGDMPGHMNYPGMPPQQQLSPNAFNMNRPMMAMGHPNMGPHPGYRGPMRMTRDMGSAMHPGQKFPPRMPGMGPMGNQGHMPGQLKLNTGPSGRKTSVSSETGKVRKEPKSRKKSKNSEKNKISERHTPDVKAKDTNLKGEAPKLNPSAPHAIPPNGLQTCIGCKREIKYPVEDCIRCIASCLNWYHRKCSGLTKAALCHLQSEECAIWACDTCINTKEINSVRPRESMSSIPLETKPNMIAATT